MPIPTLIKAHLDDNAYTYSTSVDTATLTGALTHLQLSRSLIDVAQVENSKVTVVGGTVKVN
jgi:hypothetical protein